MNSRSLSPFIVSLALIASLAACGRAWAGDTLANAEAPAPAITATEAVFTLNQEQVIAQVRDLVAAHFNLEGDFQIELLRPWVAPAPARAPISVTIAEFPAQLSSSMLLRIKAESAGGTVCDATLSLHAQIWRDAWVTREPVKRDEIFDPAALDVRRVDALRERDILPANVGDHNYSFTRGISSGRLLNWRDISRRALVRKGDIVEVAAAEGMISITMKAVALQNGASGETISVRNLQSKKDISAQVIAENRVQVRF
ncbi:MAG: flagellar basal body P-ring formation chaperone FlgA [Opitutaceae bacterium]|jgi:flagella basal body P-ring formation protein FlgA